MSNIDYKNRIKLTSYDAMFGITGKTEPTAKEQTKSEHTDKIGNGIIEVKIRDLHTFKNHPFSVIEDASMDELIVSLKHYGVLSPLLVRVRPEGGYELISGHRRRHAAIKAGLTSVPAIVKDIDDDEATILMVDANLQRPYVFPSEKAKAYAMKYEALKHQGKKSGDPGRTIYKMEEENGESHAQIQRYIKLANLREELMILLDDDKLQMRPGVQLADLGFEEQGWVFDLMKKEHMKVTEAQAIEIRSNYKEGLLSQGSLLDILSTDKEIRRKVSFGAKRLDHYFTPDTTNEEISKLIIRLLEEWKANGGTL